MDISDFVRSLREGCDDVATMVAHHHAEARAAQLVGYPDWVHQGLRAALEAQGIPAIFAHQRRAADQLD